MRRFRLEPLIGIRERRLDRARQAVQDARRVLAERIAERDRIVERISQTAQERSATQAELAQCATVDRMKCAQSRLEWLQDRAVEHQRELAAADKAIAQANIAVAEAMAVLRRAQKKLDAIVEQRQNWRTETAKIAILAEEELSDELAGRRLISRR